MQLSAMKQLLIFSIVTLSVGCLRAQRLFFPGRAMPRLKAGTVEIEGFYAESDLAPLVVADPDLKTSSLADDDDIQERKLVSFQSRPNIGFLSSRFQSNAKDLVQFVDYVTVTKVEPPLCIACTCLKSGVSETCAKYGGKLQVTLTATLNASAAVVASATGCTIGADGMTLNCTQAPVTFVITPTLTNGALTVGTTPPAAPSLTCTGTASPLSCTFTPATGVATTLNVPYTLGPAGFALTPPPKVDNTAVTCTVGAMGTTLSCTYTPPAFTTKVTVTVNPEVLASVAGTGATCTVSGTTITCLIDPPTTLSVCDIKCLNADGTVRTAPEICDTDCKYAERNTVVKCNDGYPAVVKSRPTQVCSSTRKREVGTPFIESSMELADSDYRRPRDFQVNRTTQTITVTTTGAVTATYVAKANCLPTNLVAAADC